jgi:hypothetical protein
MCVCVCVCVCVNDSFRTMTCQAPIGSIVKNAMEQPFGDFTLIPRNFSFYLKTSKSFLLLHVSAHTSESPKASISEPHKASVAPAASHSSYTTKLSTINHASANYGINMPIQVNPDTTASIMKRRKESQQHKESIAAVISTM